MDDHDAKEVIFRFQFADQPLHEEIFDSQEWQSVLSKTPPDWMGRMFDPRSPFYSPECCVHWSPEDFGKVREFLLRNTIPDQLDEAIKWSREMSRWQLEPPGDWVWKFPELAVDLLRLHALIQLPTTEGSEPSYSYIIHDTWLRVTDESAMVCRVSPSGRVIEFRKMAIQSFTSNSWCYWLVSRGSEDVQLVMVESNHPTSSFQLRVLKRNSDDEDDHHPPLPVFQLESPLSVNVDFDVRSFPDYAVIACPHENVIQIFRHCTSAEEVRVSSVPFDFSPFEDQACVSTITAGPTSEFYALEPWVLLISRRNLPLHSLHFYQGEKLIHVLPDLTHWYYSVCGTSVETPIYLLHFYFESEQNQLYLLYISEPPEGEKRLLLCRLHIDRPDWGVQLVAQVNFSQSGSHFLSFRLCCTRSWIWITVNDPKASDQGEKKDLCAVFRVCRKSLKIEELSTIFQRPNFTRCLFTEHPLRHFHFLQNGDLCILRHQGTASICSFDSSLLSS